MTLCTDRQPEQDYITGLTTTTTTTNKDVRISK